MSFTILNNSPEFIAGSLSNESDMPRHSLSDVRIRPAFTIAKEPLSVYITATHLVIFSAVQNSGFSIAYDSIALYARSSKQDKVDSENENNLGDCIYLQLELSFPSSVVNNASQEDSHLSGSKESINVESLNGSYNENESADDSWDQNLEEEIQFSELFIFHQDLNKLDELYTALCKAISLLPPSFSDPQDLLDYQNNQAFSDTCAPNNEFCQVQKDSGIEYDYEYGMESLVHKTNDSSIGEGDLNTDSGDSSVLKISPLEVLNETEASYFTDPCDIDKLTEAGKATLERLSNLLDKDSS